MSATLVYWYEIPHPKKNDNTSLFYGWESWWSSQILDSGRWRDQPQIKCRIWEYYPRLNQDVSLEIWSDVITLGDNAH